MNIILCKQLSADYCCTIEEVRDEKNQFHVYHKEEGRRRFQESEECFLKIVAVNDKLLFTGREDIMKLCEERYAGASGAWFMEAKTLVELSMVIREYGYQIDQAHPFYIAEGKSQVHTAPYQIVYYRGDEIEQFRDRPDVDEAFAFSEDAPDEIGVAAFDHGRMLGIAGVSADSPYLWQIGINVLPEARGKNIGAMLVGLLKNEVLDLGKLPYYGTAMSHTASQKVAMKAGFMPAWAELVTERIRE